MEHSKVQKDETNSESQSEAILLGSLCLLNKFSTKRLDKSSAVAVVSILREKAILENLSTTTRMVSKFFDRGS